jgi:hypothetical protein
MAHHKRELFPATFPGAYLAALTKTRRHLTTGNAKFYTQPLRELLQTAPQRTM